MAESFRIFSYVSTQGTLPSVLGRPLGAGQRLQVDGYEPESPDQVFALLNIYPSGPSVLMHRRSGLAVRFGATNTPLTFEVFLPFDPRFLLLVTDLGQGLVTIGEHGGSNVLSVAGDNYQPPTPVLANPFVDHSKTGQKWQLVPVAT